VATGNISCVCAECRMRVCAVYSKCPRGTCTNMQSYRPACFFTTDDSPLLLFRSCLPREHLPASWVLHCFVLMLTFLPHLFTVLRQNKAGNAETRHRTKLGKNKNPFNSAHSAHACCRSPEIWWAVVALETVPLSLPHHQIRCAIMDQKHPNTFHTTPPLEQKSGQRAGETERGKRAQRRAEKRK